MTHLVKYVIPALMLILSAGIYVSLWMSTRIHPENTGINTKFGEQDVPDVPVLQDQGQETEQANK